MQDARVCVFASVYACLADTPSTSRQSATAKLVRLYVCVHVCLCVRSQTSRPDQPASQALSQSSLSACLCLFVSQSAKSASLAGWLAGGGWLVVSSTLVSSSLSLRSVLFCSSHYHSGRYDRVCVPGRRQPWFSLPVGLCQPT